MSALGDCIREERNRQDLGLRELCRLISRKKALTGREVSSAYLSQVESGYADEEKVSMDFMWAVGLALGVDPLKLFVLSRPGIDRRFLDATERDLVFRSR